MVHVPPLISPNLVYRNQKWNSLECQEHPLFVFIPISTQFTAPSFLAHKVFLLSPPLLFVHFSSFRRTSTTESDGLLFGGRGLFTHPSSRSISIDAAQGSGTPHSQGNPSFGHTGSSYSSPFSLRFDKYRTPEVGSQT